MNTTRFSQLTDPAGQLSVTNPATQSVIGRARSYDGEAVSQAIDKAENARTGWAAKTARERASILLSWHNLILENVEDLAEIVTAECGKPLSEARGEIAYGASFIQWFAEEGKRAYGETIPTFAPDKRVLTIQQPIGTCAAITPWNFPVAMITRKVAPALAAGCAMLVKPAEATPLSALALEQLAHEAGVPHDVFRVMPTTDPEAIGDVFCNHPAIRKLSFTGSTNVGQILMAKAAKNVVKLSLELGGNAPFIVFGDADIDAAVEGAIASKFRNAGQTCICANRILVQDAVHDEFVERLTQRVKQLKVGPGSTEGVQIGPLINAKGIQKVSELVDDAVQSGAMIVTGGEIDEAGPLFYTPTVLTGVDASMAITQTEIFGPVAPIIRFKGEADAIRMANDTPFGLAAYFYTRDIGRVWRVMEGLEYGMVASNDGALSTEIAPFGGWKHSGIGREGSRHGLNEYLEIKYCLMGGVNK
nr:NAD-dependent succinate-semialdehyde dehydrogenase [Henriciella litoralis]